MCNVKIHISGNKVGTLVFPSSNLQKLNKNSCLMSEYELRMLNLNCLLEYLMSLNFRIFKLLKLIAS